MNREEFFADAYERGFRRTVAALRSRGVNAATAGELAQDAWGKAWERLDSLRDKKCIFSWVFTIALNLLRDEFSRSRRMTEVSSAAADFGTSYLPDVVLIDLNRAIGNTPERQKTAIRRVYFCEQSVAEAAAALRISEGALYHLLSRGRTSIRKSMSPL